MPSAITLIPRHSARRSVGTAPETLYARCFLSGIVPAVTPPQLYIPFNFP